MDSKFGTKFAVDEKFSDKARIFLLFVVLSVPLARIPPPSAQGYSV